MNTMFKSGVKLLNSSAYDCYKTEIGNQINVKGAMIALII